MIEAWVEDILTLTDEDWSRYAFNRDPFVVRIKPDQQMNYTHEAMNCGKNLARRLRTEYGDVSPEELVKRMGLHLNYQNGQSSDGYLMFAYFEEPDSITLFLDNADATDALIDELGVRDSLGDVKTSDLLLAHELYHYLEQNQPDIYTAQKHITLWKVGPFENRSRIICLEEIGAMAFAKELVGLRCSAYLFNVLMLCPKNPQRARELYENIMAFKVKKEVLP